MTVKVLAKEKIQEAGYSDDTIIHVYKDDMGKTVGYTYYNQAYRHASRAFIVGADGHLSSEPRYRDTQQSLEQIVLDSYADNLELKSKIRL